MCETIVDPGSKKARSKTQMAAHLKLARSTFDVLLEQPSITGNQRNAMSW
jgi:hypothetical protein